MALIDVYLVSELPHPLGGVQRLYRFPSGWGLSLINGSQFHSFPFAWEAAVLGPDGEINYDTRLTSDIEIFMSDEEANRFIARAATMLQLR